MSANAKTHFNEVVQNNLFAQKALLSTEAKTVATYQYLHIISLMIHFHSEASIVNRYLAK